MFLQRVLFHMKNYILLPKVIWIVITLGLIRCFIFAKISFTTGKSFGAGGPFSLNQRRATAWINIKYSLVSLLISFPLPPNHEMKRLPSADIRTFYLESLPPTNYTTNDDDEVFSRDLPPTPLPQISRELLSSCRLYVSRWVVSVAPNLIAPAVYLLPDW